MLINDGNDYSVTRFWHRSMNVQSVPVRLKFGMPFTIEQFRANRDFPCTTAPRICVYIRIFRRDSEIEPKEPSLNYLIRRQAARICGTCSILWT
jgi:hypothetical protein